MSKTTRPMPSFNGVAEGQTATLVMPIGLSYHGLLFALGGTSFTVANMTEIRIKGNGREILAVAGSDLDIINKYNHALGAGTLAFLDFERAGLLTRAGREMTRIGTGYKQVLDRNAPDYNPTPLDNLTCEVDISGSTAPTLSAKAIQSAASPLGSIVKRRKFSRTITGAGTLEISDLPKGDVIDKIYIKHTGNLDRVTFERDNFLVFDRTDAENTFMQNKFGVRTPQTNWFVLDPSESGNGGEYLVSAVNDLRLKLEASAAESFTIYVDYIGGLTGN